MRLYKRSFLVTAAMILASFLLLGAIFIGLSYNYNRNEHVTSMETNADYVSSWTSYMLERNIATTDDSLMQTLDTTAKITDTDIMLLDTSGAVIFYTNGETVPDYIGMQISDQVESELTDNGRFTGTSTLGIYESKRFTTIAPINLGNSIVGYAAVAAHTGTLVDMWESFIGIFAVVALAVMCVALGISYYTSLRLTQPLNEMVAAVNRFGQGEFDARVEDTGRTDEIGDLTKAFNAMADSLALSEKKRQEFVANISHELKTPMTTISGFTDGILDGTIPQDKAPEYLQVVSSETKRLARLVRKMLDISKLQSPENVTGHEKFDLCDIMCQMLISLEGKIVDHKLDMDVNIPDSSVMVWGDPDAITQVGYNLMDNAIKFSPAGSVIGMSITTKDKKAYVSIRNNGPTIAPDELPLIFDRFHKSDKSRSMDKDGVGLGLYIVKTILNNHKEEISVTSENGVTTFTFTMTLAR